MSDTTTVPAQAGGPVTKAVNWLKAHVAQIEQDVLPALKQAEGLAGQIVAEAQKLEAAVSAADPAIGSQLTASASILRDIAEALKAL